MISIPIARSNNTQNLRDSAALAHLFASICDQIAGVLRPSFPARRDKEQVMAMAKPDRLPSQPCEIAPLERTFEGREEKQTSRLKESSRLTSLPIGPEGRFSQPRW
jgi:hypothetical protein